MSISIAHTALHDTFHHSENDKQMNPIMASIIEILIDAEEHTANTREIADRCDLSIYSARNWLIRLEEAGFVCRKVAPRGYLWHFTGFNGAKNKQLRWSPDKPTD